MPPNVFFFIVHQDGQPLPDSVNAALKMYYIDGEEKIYRPPPNIDDSTFVFQAGRFSGNLSNSKVLANPYIDMPKTWYLDFPDGEVDTVKIQITELNCEAAKKDPCYCNRPFTSVQFNGVEAPEYTEEQTASGKKIFLFDK